MSGQGITNTYGGTGGRGVFYLSPDFQKKECFLRTSAMGETDRRKNSTYNFLSPQG